MQRLRTRRAALLLGVLGAGLTLVTMSLTWGSVHGASSSSGAVLTGREAAPAAFGLSLAALAGVGVLLLVGPLGRRLVGALLVLLGGGAVVAVIAAALDLEQRAAAGLSSSVVGPVPNVAVVSTSPWWAWVAVLGGLLIVAAGVLGLMGGAGWPDPSSRYGSAAADRPVDPWRALDEGVDPTLDD